MSEQDNRYWYPGNGPVESHVISPPQAVAVDPNESVIGNLVNHIRSVRSTGGVQDTSSAGPNYFEEEYVPLPERDDDLLNYVVDTVVTNTGGRGMCPDTLQEMLAIVHVHRLNRRDIVRESLVPETPAKKRTNNYC